MVLGLNFIPISKKDTALIKLLLLLISCWTFVSLANLLTDRPIDDPTGPSIINRLLDRVDNRVPVLAAGGILTPDQAKQTLDTGLSMVAIGRGLIINPDWVDSLREGQEIVVELDPTKVKALNIPEKLWTIIQNMPGWIPLKQ